MTMTLDGTAGMTAPSGAVYNGLQRGTAVASTSGVSVDFTSIPSWAKRITVMLSDVSTNGTSSLAAQIGDSGGIETTGYTSSLGTSDGSGFATTSTSMFLVCTTAAASVVQGVFTLVNLSGNTWLISGTASSGGTLANFSAGTKTLSATLDRVRITTVNGTDTFDAGSINIMYE